MERKIKIKLTNGNRISNLSTKRRNGKGNKEKKSKKIQKNNKSTSNPNVNSDIIIKDQSSSLFEENSSSHQQEVSNHLLINKENHIKNSISLSFTDNFHKNNQVKSKQNEEDSSIDKLEYSRPAKRWEKKKVLIPNVFDFTKEIYLYRWVLIDDNESIYQREDQRNIGQDNYLNQSKNESRLREYSKKYQCSFEECGKIFIDASSLRKHIVIHGEKQYICKYEGCEKKFLDNSKLRRHQLVHTGEKPFKCDICGKKFSLDFNLKTHLRTHTGEKPYICSYSGCDKRFTQSSNLTAHEKTHKEMELLGKRIIFSTKTEELNSHFKAGNTISEDENENENEEEVNENENDEEEEDYDDEDKADE